MGQSCVSLFDSSCPFEEDYQVNPCELFKVQERFFFLLKNGGKIFPRFEDIQCDQIGRNWAIWAIFFGVGRILF
jgi:hypothetical protein